MEPVKFGKYVLIEKIATGSIAEIYLAEPAPGEGGGLPKQLVIKRLLEAHASNRDSCAMFQDEARIVSCLSHPNVVRVVEVGSVEGASYIAMEYVNGRDLQHVCDQGSKEDNHLPLPVATYVVAEIAAALSNVHQQNDAYGRSLKIVHSDVNPLNILLSYGGKVKLTDFGIARAANAASRLRRGQLQGKTAYLSPEQCSGLEPDHRSDIFSLGIVLYEITTGKRLFKCGSQIETIQAVMDAKITPPSEVRADYPAGLEPIVMKALAKSSGDRYSSCEEFRAELLKFLSVAGGVNQRDQLAAYLQGLYGVEAPVEEEEYFPVEPPVEDEAPRKAPRRPPAPIPGPSQGMNEDPLDMKPISGVDPEPAEPLHEILMEPEESPPQQVEPQKVAVRRSEARRKRGHGSMAKVHKVASLADDEPDELYDALNVSKRRILGWTGIITVALLLLAGIYFLVALNMGQGEGRKSLFRKPSPEELETKKHLDPPPPEPDAVLRVLTEPEGAEVFVNYALWDQEKPVMAKVHKGQKHTVFVAMPGHLPKISTVEFTEDQEEAEIKIELEPAEEEHPTGTAVIASEPGGMAVYQYGEQIGTTPASLEMPSGVEHVVVLKKDGYTPHVVAFTLFPEVENAIMISMALAEVDGERRNLYMESKPSNISIHTDDSYYGSTPRYRREMTNSFFSYEFKHEDHHGSERSFFLGSNSITYQAFLPRIVKEKGTLTLNAKPDVMVFIGSDQIGRTPIKRMEIEEGTYSITVSNDAGDLRGTFELEIKPKANLVKRISWSGKKMLVR